MAGAIGVGALGLALVGPGSFASFTSSVTASQSITAGTFQLEGVGSTPSVTGALIGDANSIGQPTLKSSNGSEPSTPDFNGNTLSFTLGNINPGDTYTEPVTIYDVGSLQGQIDTVTYTPGTSGKSLEGAMTVALQYKVGKTWTDVHTQGEETNCGGCAGVPVPASSAHTFLLDYSFGPNFVQPNPHMYDAAQASAAGFSTNELSSSYRVVFSFTDTTTSQNSLETVSASPSLSFNGINTP